jgi:hypothetical protein
MYQELPRVDCTRGGRFVDASFFAVCLEFHLQYLGVSHEAENISPELERVRNMPLYLSTF